jgi:hypothetical protein
MKQKLTDEEKKERRRLSYAKYREKNRSKLCLAQANRRSNDEGYRILDNLRRAASMKKKRAEQKKERERLYWLTYEQTPEYRKWYAKELALAKKILRPSW